MYTFPVRPGKCDPQDRYCRLKQPLESQVDLRPWDSVVEDQGALGSCSALAMTSAYEIMTNISDASKYQDLSDLFVYYNTRGFYNQIRVDAGAYLQDTVRSVSHFGICTEALWPYDISKFTVKPSDEAYEDAAHRKLENARWLGNIHDMLAVINTRKPLIMGLLLFSEFMFLNQNNYIMTMPTKDSRDLGGHAMTILGYDIPGKTLLAKNSFGTDWGNQGYCLVPFEYVETYVFETWCFDLVIK